MTSPAPLPEPTHACPIASVQLRAASSMRHFWLLAACYLALIGLAWWPGAIGAFFIMPLNCPPQSPRRALWLWTMGLLASVASVAHGRHLLTSEGGLDGLAAHASPMGLASVGLIVVGALLFLWQLSWVKSPRRV